MIAIGAPVATVSPSLTISSRITPVTGDGTSALTLSVETSTNASYFSTESPIFFSHCATVPSVTVSPNCGIVIVVILTALRPRLRAPHALRGAPGPTSQQPGRTRKMLLCSVHVHHLKSRQVAHRVDHLLGRRHELFLER